MIRELGKSGKVAAIIKADLQENSEDYGEYTENGYQDTRVKENGEIAGPLYRSNRIRKWTGRGPS